MKKTVVWLMLITIVSKVIGFSRDLVLAYFYGTSNISDAYLISLTIPIVLFSFIGAGITASYIPIYSAIEKEQGESVAFDYTSNLINLILVLCVILFGLSYVFAKPLVMIFASGFNEETLNLAIQFTRISMLSVFFSGMVFVFQSLLQVKNKFYIPALVGLPLNGVFLLSIVLSQNDNLIILAIGSVIAILAQFIFLYPFIHQSGFRYKRILKINDEHIKTMIKVALPVIIGVSVNEINILVDRTLASQIAIGGISSLTYANRLNGFIVNIFVITIATVLFPTIAKMAVVNNMDGLKRAVMRSMNAISIILIPATIGFMVFARPIIELLYGRGEFSESAIVMTSSALFFYSIGMLGYSYREILAKAFYSMQDTATPMKNATIGVVVNIILNFILSSMMGISGLALATSISSTLTFILLMLSLRQKVGTLGFSNMVMTYVKILMISLIMAAVSWYVYSSMLSHVTNTLALLIAIGCGMMVYGLLLLFVKIEEVDDLIQPLLRRL